MIALIVLSAILLSVPMIASMGLVPFFALIVIVGFCMRLGFKLIGIMLDSFATFFHISRDQALTFHFCLLATLIMPYLLPLWVIVLSFQFPIWRDHA